MGRGRRLSSGVLAGLVRCALSLGHRSGNDLPSPTGRHLPRRHRRGDAGGSSVLAERLTTARRRRTSDYYTIDAHYAFVHSDTGRIQNIAGTIDVAAITASNQQLPFLLGWDILQNFVLAVDSRSGTVTLS
jgi:hypothetical protein